MMLSSLSAEVRMNSFATVNVLMRMQLLQRISACAVVGRWATAIDSRGCGCGMNAGDLGMNCHPLNVSISMP
jgi:hypothetical protein